MNEFSLRLTTKWEQHCSAVCSLFKWEVSHSDLIHLFFSDLNIELHRYNISFSYFFRWLSIRQGGLTAHKNCKTQTMPHSGNDLEHLQPAACHLFFYRVPEWNVCNSNNRVPVDSNQIQNSAHTREICCQQRAREMISISREKSSRKWKEKFNLEKSSTIDPFTGL